MELLLVLQGRRVRYVARQRRGVQILAVPAHAGDERAGVSDCLAQAHDHQADLEPDHFVRSHTISTILCSPQEKNTAPVTIAQKVVSVIALPPGPPARGAPRGGGAS